MRPRYRQFVCSTLTLTVWCVVAYSIYFHQNATQDISQTDRRAVETANDSIPLSEDGYTNEWTTEQVAINKSAHSEQRSPRGRPEQARSFLRPTFQSMISQPKTTVKPGSHKSTAIRTIHPKPVKGKPVAVKQNSSTPVTSAPVPRKATKDPVDEYSDMGGIVIKQSNSSTPINPHPFHYTLNPRTTCDVDPSCELFLLVYVHTRPNNIKQREMIRNTWGDVKNYAVTIRRIFVMGLPEGEYVQEAIKLESSLYHDILQENFLDTYRNLTYKAVGALRWVKDYCSNAKFVLKTDDDSFVNMHVLLELLVSRYNAREWGSRSLICNVWYKSPVARYGKWAVTVAQRKHPRWPDFCQGLAYIITPSVASALYNASFDVPFLWMDDVYVTGFLAKKIGLRHTQITKSFFKDVHIEEQLMNPQHWKNVLFSHIQNPDLRRWAWNKVVKMMKNSSTSTTNPSCHTIPAKPFFLTTTKAVVHATKQPCPSTNSTAPVMRRKEPIPTTNSTKTVMSTKPPLPVSHSEISVGHR